VFSTWPKLKFWQHHLKNLFVFGHVRHNDQIAQGEFPILDLIPEPDKSTDGLVIVKRLHRPHQMGGGLLCRAAAVQVSAEFGWIFLQSPAGKKTLEISFVGTAKGISRQAGTAK